MKLLFDACVSNGKPHSGIIRLVNLSSRQQAQACLRVIELHGDEITSGAIITVEPSRIRIHLPGT